MAIQHLAYHPFHNGFNPTVLLHACSEVKLFGEAKGVTLLTT
jgi:hypothetical protein